MFCQFNNKRPVVDPSAFVHPHAAVTGDVVIGKNVYIGPGAAIRGDWGRIVIEDGCNVQENCTIHMFPGDTVLLKEGAHIGHGAIIHGATIGRNCLIGMNSVILDDVVLGDECIVGALSLIRNGEQIPNRSLVAGNPGKIIKPVSDEMIQWKTQGTAIYQALPNDMRRSWSECEPLAPDGPQVLHEPYSPSEQHTPDGPQVLHEPHPPGEPHTPGESQALGEPHAPGKQSPPAAETGQPDTTYRPWNSPH